MDKVFKEIQFVDVYDPMTYRLDCRYTNCIVYHKWQLGGIFAVYAGSWADNHMDMTYWRRIDYQYLPKIVNSRPVIWYKFSGKHARVSYE